jgi:hypothetical protein
MATWAGWLNKAKEKGVPLHENIRINLAEDVKRINASGLPVYDLLLIQKGNYSKSKDQIREFTKKHSQCWVRCYNKEKEQRFHKLDLKNYEEIISYIESLPINPDNFIIQVFEFHANKFGGNIISNDSNTYIEICYGPQEQIDNSTGNPFHGNLDYHGKLNFKEKEIPEEIQRISKKVLNYIKISGKDFLVGYFEFAVSPEEKVFFWDYKINLK